MKNEVINFLEAKTPLCFSTFQNFCYLPNNVEESFYFWCIRFLKANKIFIHIIPFLSVDNKSLKEYFVFKGKIFNFNSSRYGEYFSQIEFHSYEDCFSYIVKLAFEDLEKQMLLNQQKAST